MNKIIKQDLQLKISKKHNIHQLLPRHVAQCKIFFNILCEIYLLDINIEIIARDKNEPRWSVSLPWWLSEKKR